MLNRNQPLGLPPGSVRAILSLLVIGVFAWVVVRSNIVIEAKDLNTIAILILGFYFIDKARRGAGE